jgi:hypothetical protein
MAKRAGSVVSEVRGSHAVYVSKPEAVVALIKQAAQGVNRRHTSKAMFWPGSGCDLADSP